MEPLIEIFNELQQDAVIWKGKRVWQKATGPHELVIAMDQLAAMLLSINNETKRTAYVKQLCTIIANERDEQDEEIDRLSKRIATAEKRAERLQAKKAPTEEEAAELTGLAEQAAALRTELSFWEETLLEELNEKDLKKHISTEASKRKKEQETKRINAEYEKQIRSAEDAGLPPDFEGSMQDVYDALKFGIYEHDKRYYTRGGKSDAPISNFTMNIIYHIPTNDETSFRLIAVKNVYNYEVVININTDDFVSVGSFKKILARRGDFVFKGTETDLCNMQEYLQRNETSAQRIDILGWNKAHKFWAWANGLTVVNDDSTTSFIPVDDHGIIDFKGTRYFIPACSKMYAHKDGMYVNEKKFVYCQPIAGFGFAEWSKTMYLAYGKKSIAGILWYIGSLFRDVIMKKVRRYPILNLFGPPGAGKGEMFDSLMHCFGFKQDQIMLSGASTVVGFMRKFAQFYNAVVGLDEYKNGLQQKVIESLKNLYDGIGYERGKMSNDFATESTPVSSSCALLGQDMPTIEPALFMRCILLAFQDGKFSETQRINYKKLKEDIEPNGLSYITANMLQFRSTFEASFKDDYAVIFKETVKDVANVEVDDRMIMNISILLTIMHITKSALQFPFTYAEAKAWLIDNMLQQHTILAGNNDVAKFWSVIEALFYKNEVIEERDFKLQDGYLYIRIQQVQPLYQKEMIERRDMNYLAKPTLEHYLSIDTSVFVGREKKRFDDGSNTWCFKMKYAKLGIDLIRMKKMEYESIEQHTARLENKYREMAGHVNGTGTAPAEKVNDEEVPFPVYKPVS